MSHKTLLKDRKDCVKDMIQGINDVFPGLSVFPELGVTFINKDRGNKVAILSGGGSGHEPFPTGFVANNMLTGAVSGHIFSSPSTPNIFAAINILNNLNKGGVLIVVMNYTGDQLNFGLAIERAINRGIKVEKVSISDDVALLGTEHAAVTGNRGISGCAFVLKLLGAMSEEGKTMEELKKEFDDISLRLASLGACLVPCRLPKSSTLLFDLKEDEFSLGCGVHGEAGISTLPMSHVEDIVRRVLDKIYDSGVINANDKACVLIGNLGSLTPIECFVVAKVVKTQLSHKNIKPERMYVGAVMSSLDMKGFQVSILNTTTKPEWLRYLDSPTDAFGWMGTSYSFSPLEPVKLLIDSDEIENLYLGPELNKNSSYLFKSAVLAACAALKNKKDEINELDSGCGDGDCGSTLEYFADGIIAQKDHLRWKWIASCLGQLSKIAEVEMGGTSGAVYSLLLAGAAKGINRSWQDACTMALQTLYNYSPARVGHRTLIDALAPACDAYCTSIATGKYNWRHCMKLAVTAAEAGCQNTSTMKAIVGRASNADPSRLKQYDAGAFAVTVWLQGINNYLQNN